MFGFLFGLACLGGLYWYLTREHRGFGGGAPRFRRRWARRFFLRRLFDELDATPSQERVIEDALRELEDEKYGLRQELMTSREEVARILRNEQFDRSALDGVAGRQDEALGKLRGRLFDALSKVHGVLDNRQRARLADVINDGPWRCRRRHSSRSYA